VAAIFTPLQATLKEISAIKNCENAGWQKTSHTFSEKFRVFKREFIRKIRFIGLKFSEITEIVMLFQYSEVLLDNDKHMLMRQKKKKKGHEQK